MAALYHLFISHSWSYGDQYDNLVALLEQRPLFDFINHSVPKDDPIHNAPTSRALYEAIKEQIAPCHVVLIVAGVYASYSSWIDKEIYIAKNEFPFAKPIVAIRPWANERVSSVVSEAADRVVAWNTASVADAVVELTREVWGV